MKRRWTRHLQVTWTTIALFLAAGKAPASPGGTTSRLPVARQTADPALTQQADGKALFDRMCAACHGKGGGGDGPAAKGLKPKPASFKEAAFQTGRTNQQLTGAIQNGKPPMPAFGKQLSPTQVVSLVDYIRTLGPATKKP